MKVLFVNGILNDMSTCLQHADNLTKKSETRVLAFHNESFGFNGTDLSMYHFPKKDDNFAISFIKKTRADFNLMMNDARSAISIANETGVQLLKNVGANIESSREKLVVERLKKKIDEASGEGVCIIAHSYGARITFLALKKLDQFQNLKNKKIEIYAFGGVQLIPNHLGRKVRNYTHDAASISIWNDYTSYIGRLFWQEKKVKDKYILVSTNTGGHAFASYEDKAVNKIKKFKQQIQKEEREERLQKEKEERDRLARQQHPMNAREIAKASEKSIRKESKSKYGLIACCILLFFTIVTSIVAYRPHEQD